MRITTVSSFFPPEISGAGISVFQNSLWMARSGIHVQVIVPNYRRKAPTNPWIDELQGNGVEVVELETKPFSATALGLMPTRASQAVLDAAVVAFRPDVMLVSDPYWFRLVSGIRFRPERLRRTGCVAIAVCHGDLLEAMRRIKMRGVSIAALLVWHSLRSFESCFFPSAFLAGRYPRAPQPRVVQFLGVDKARFTPVTRGGRSGTTVLYVGRMSPDKKVGLVVEAAKRIGGSHRRVAFRLVGDGPDLGRLRGMGLDHIAFDGPRFDQDLVDAYHTADIFVSACDYESFGLTVAEAMSTGLPVIVPDRGAASSHFVNGHSGLTFRTDDVADLIDKLEALVTNATLREELGRAASIRPLGWDEATQNLISACETVWKTRR